MRVCFIWNSIAEYSFTKIMLDGAAQFVAQFNREQNEPGGTAQSDDAMPLLPEETGSEGIADSFAALPETRQDKIKERGT